MKIKTAILLPITLFLFVGCEKELETPTQVDKKTQASLVGKWTHGVQNETQEGHVGYTVYNQDNTFFSESKVFEEGEYVKDKIIEGTWEINGSLLTVTGRYLSEPELSSNEYTVISELLEISEERYVWRAPSGHLKFETRIE